ncbi:hypothetical protein LO772_21740 [Yinghuangia sp. ASG 101]|uniref:hypothetical protein n=1 Tax=Yinghuangia sp. ASG 101 TaxID=2896848 RepID=UPI001E5A5D12|nr:hypothetical protein [Yinghuangia sp. ASG 101]UGQ09547.1 hypothetical protein LO772_21740 [Yinghuangia sp. ASG 101]
MRFRGFRTAYEACAALAECLQPVPLTADWNTAPRNTGPHLRRTATAVDTRPAPVRRRARTDAGQGPTAP